ncbi:Glycerol-1-phosphate phosphohydrolase 2 [Cercospora beticola]|uniref:Glycerol-1-phosphate phosphohydrolase 2 n=1 Tax=Cercospora beticola TaxID=122368 RepID=A0A2G5ID91_CERBT|nr:Glycerol-1-phosphate phosphohydrolase 2 [Cercospora beticola]PIB02494.1 Glycerol-1-phosphate phosphohydrolase 2 [Cercospora beticola]WPA96246.1 hypothetical protein RHO25_000852 [Cercospora beticola]CAK1355461.1 unnamed protein product [Cercospora beticola]
MGSIAQEPEEHNFSSPPSTHSFSALLFDMDGTIIDSTAAIEKHWQQLGREIGVPGDEILKTSHGRRSIDVLAILAPERANWEYVCHVEGLIPKIFGNDPENGAKEIPGSRRLLDELEAVGAPWAIVTSGTRPLVQGWLDVMGLAKPRFMVTAEEVGRGKPDPECYRKGAGLLGKGEVVEGEEVLVLEDAPAGVRSGKAAGYKVVALATTHDVGRLKEAGADWIVRDMRSVRFVGYEGQVRIEIRDALVV